MEFSTILDRAFRAAYNDVTKPAFVAAMVALILQNPTALVLHFTSEYAWNMIWLLVGSAIVAMFAWAAVLPVIIP